MSDALAAFICASAAMSAGFCVHAALSGKRERAAVFAAIAVYLIVGLLYKKP